MAQGIERQAARGKAAGGERRPGRDAARPAGGDGAPRGDGGERAAGAAAGRADAPAVRAGGRPAAVAAGVSARASAVVGRVGSAVEDGLERLALREPLRHAADEAGRRARALRAAQRDVDWARVGTFGAGVVVGALLGAGIALLTAPASGQETRVRLARGTRRARRELVDRVEDVGDVVRRAGRKGTRGARRAMERSRWAAEDAWARVAR